METDDPRWSELSPVLAEERDEMSFMALLLDEELASRARDAQPNRVLDFGTGTGALAFAVAGDGIAVDALEPTPSQYDILAAAVAERPGSSVRPLRSEDEVGGPYDLILCINVLDHIEDHESTINRLAGWLRPGGRLLLVVPHPLKDLGDWHRDPPGGGPESYRHYVLHGYLAEGVCLKNREDSQGRVVARDLPSHHRTISTYFNALRRADLEIDELLEPVPEPSTAGAHPILQAKASRIPYFLFFDCRRPEDLEVLGAR